MNRSIGIWSRRQSELPTCQRTLVSDLCCFLSASPGWNELPALSVGAGLPCRTWILRRGKQRAVNADLKKKKTPKGTSAAVGLTEDSHHSLLSLGRL